MSLTAGLNPNTVGHYSHVTHTGVIIQGYVVTGSEVKGLVVKGLTL